MHLPAVTAGGAPAAEASRCEPAAPVTPRAAWQRRAGTPRRRCRGCHRRRVLSRADRV